MEETEERAVSRMEVEEEINEERSVEIIHPTITTHPDDPSSPKPIPLSNTSIDKKEELVLKIKKSSVKKTRVIIDKFDEFIPEFLLQINHLRPKSVIRLGSNYQVDVPRQVPYKHKYRDISNLQVWGGSGPAQTGFGYTGNPEDETFDQEALKKFREVVGDNRTEEELCHLILQYRSSWDRIVGEISKRKGELRKFYTQKDRAR